MLVLVMGVAGAGKSTLAAALAEALGCAFVEADQYHDEAVRAQMAAGQGLSDAQRLPWLKRVAAAAQAMGPCVLACSALKPTYRAMLAPDRVIFLSLTQDDAIARLAARSTDGSGHYAGPALAESQFAALDPPVAGPDVLVLDATRSRAELLALASHWIIGHTGEAQPTPLQ